jgi:DNA repair protein RadD
MTYELRPEYQLPAHIATIEHCKKSNEPAFHSMSVGAGKTINIGFMCQHVTSKGGKVLVLARQGELIEQNANDAWSIGVKTSVFSASLNKFSTTFDCVMGTEGTVANHLLQAFSRWLPDCILIDECHQVDWHDVDGCIKAAESGADFYNAKFAQYGKIIAHFLMKKPKLRIIGYTGSPYRGVEAIKGQFWKHQLSDVGTMQLISMGFLVPPVFGFGDDDHHYDLGEFKPVGGEGAHDFTQKELAAMGRKLTKEVTMTQRIMEQVQDIARNRNGVLITCASKKHCEQVAECLPAGAWGIVTDDTSTKNRKAILDKAKSGELKYVIQITCLTTGVNVPLWDVLVILRKIGSLTLLIQLTGRVLRQLKPEQVSAGMKKEDALVLDFTDTFESMGDIYDDPIVNQALLQKRSDKRDDSIECPKCATLNSKHARRCCGVDQKGTRCDHFWVSRECKNCGAHNDTTAKDCRECGAVLIDPNAKLLNKAYTDADFKPVLSFKASPGKGDNLIITYRLDSKYFDDGVEKDEVAREFFSPFSTQPHIKNMWYRWLMQHCPLPDKKNKIIKFRTNAEIAEAINQHAEVPTHITHRINPKGYSVINRKKFKSADEVVINPTVEHDASESEV